MEIRAYIVIAGQALAMLALAYIAVGNGSWARRRPLVLFAIGVGLTLVEVAVVDLLSMMEWAITEACKNGETTLNCGSSSHVAETFKKMIEIGFAAVGAGLVALSMDIRSQIAFEEAEAGFEKEEQSILEWREQWSKDFEGLGRQLDTFSPQQRTDRFDALKWKLVDLLEREQDLYERRRVHRPWAFVQRLQLPTIRRSPLDKDK